ncbi:MAG: 16S rRNA (guanine(527)-N(7))-methyltransferase RsmG [Rhodothalassiaceae bacterium]
MRVDRAAFLEAVAVSRETRERLDRYAALLAKWQTKLNLVGPATLPQLWVRHFLDSAQILDLVAAHRPGGLPARWVDLGSGAGFPGLVIALLGGGPVELVESDARKCSFLRQVIAATDAPARVHQARIETITDLWPDLVVARALAPLPRLLPLAARLCAPESEIWLLKGAHVEEELTRCPQSWTFDLESFPSRTGPGARILRIRNLEGIDE